MIRSRLSSKLFASAVTVFAALTLAIYAFSVPLIKDTVFDLEERAGRAVLDTVYELANRIHLDLESHRALALEVHRQRLQDMVDLADSYIDSVHRQVEDGKQALTLNMDVTSRNSGNWQIFATDLALIGPDGNAVVADDVGIGSLPGTDEGVTTPDLWMRFLVDELPPGDFIVKLTPGSWFIGEDGVTEATFDFTIGQ